MGAAFLSDLDGEVDVFAAFGESNRLEIVHPLPSNAPLKTFNDIFMCPVDGDHAAAEVTAVGVK